MAAHRTGIEPGGAQVFISNSQIRRHVSLPNNLTGTSAMPSVSAPLLDAHYQRSFGALAGDLPADHSGLAARMRVSAKKLPDCAAPKDLATPTRRYRTCPT
ncbi:hypothetical protein XFF6990_230004 [Xanthomonas citri pv. fuscans]|uniref:Uncharacterized protein n=1 Tax=Xanthomonas campestris pv. phaseoli TaxID=317013 RepID=A0A7Z7J129_XANCH|nr:hypothetical protein XFF6990_230004 [Xanthomonas citri pv. fuscans]SOO24176.1 hypothetical protein XFF6991_320175 [Xanthomonas phaseoli pv. phaseoli]